MPGPTGRSREQNTSSSRRGLASLLVGLDGQTLKYVAQQVVASTIKKNAPRKENTGCPGGREKAAWVSRGRRCNQRGQRGQSPGATGCLAMAGRGRGQCSGGRVREGVTGYVAKSSGSGVRTSGKASGQWEDLTFYSE